jgi:hypothetical protein
VPSDAGSLAQLAGQAMLVLALVLTMAGLLATLPRLLRVRRRALALSVQLQAARAEALDGMERLERRREETEEYLRPIRRLRRWIRHPLSVATMQSYRRKRRRRPPPV